MNTDPAESERYMIFEGVIQWTQAAALQSDRVAVAQAAQFRPAGGASSAGHEFPLGGGLSRHAPGESLLHLAADPVICLLPTDIEGDAYGALRAADNAASGQARDSSAYISARPNRIRSGGT
jgi:hypothetical protein